MRCESFRRLTGSVRTLGLAAPGLGLVAALSLGSARPATAQTFAAATNAWTLGGAAPTFVLATDVDGDGHVDLLISDQGNNNLVIALGNGAGVFTPTITDSVGAGPEGIAVGDINGDGLPDILVANSGENTISVRTRDTGGGFTFTSQPHITTGAAGAFPYDVAIADFNGDGKPDLVTVNRANNTVAVALGDGAGRFGNGTVLDVTLPEVGVGSSPARLALGDLNGDGKPEVVVANSGSSNVTVLGWSTLAGNLTVLSTVSVGAGPRSLALADVNGDGKLDLITANRTDSTVTVLLGNGSGGFAAASGSPFSSGSNTFQVATGDFNLDGKVDIAVTNLSGTPTVSVLNGDGTGAFGAATTFAVGAGPQGIAVADANEDGLSDIFTANGGTTSVSYLRNNLAPSADLSVTKTDGKTQAAPGTADSYTITVSNAGPQLVRKLTLVDTLPPALAAPSFTASAGSYDAVSGVWSGLSLVPGSSVTLTLSGTIAASATGNLVNTATVSLPAGSLPTGVTDPGAGNNAATDTDTLVPTADMGITKTGTASVVPGNNVTYTITVTNLGPSDATGVSVADPTPAGLTFVSNSGNCTVAFPCALGTVPAGATRTITSVFKVGSGYTVPNPIANTATVSTTATDLVAGNNSATANTTVVAGSADLGVTKTGPASVAAGANATYTITVTNTGPSDAAAVSIADPTPTGLTFVSNTGNCVTAFPCALGSIPAGATRTITSVFKVDNAYGGPSPFTNTATVSSTTADPASGNNSGSAQTTVLASADLSITKTGTTAVVAGNNVTYTIAVTNAGPSDAAAVSVADVTPAGLTFVSNSGACVTAFPCALGTVTNGATQTITAVFKVNSNYSGASPFTNTASVSSTTPDSTPGNNSASAQTTVSASADLSITKTGTASVVAGSNVTYTITVTNNGPSDATGVSVADSTPAGLTFVSNSGSCTTVYPCTLGTIAPAATRTITTVYTVGSGYSGPSPFTNTATVTSTSTDPTPGNNSASAQTTVTLSADLGITKTGPASVAAGNNVTYTLTVTNTGPSDATGVSVADATPAGLTFVSNTGNCVTAFPCSLGAVPAGATRTITSVFTVPSNYSGTSPFTNTATVSSTSTDPTPANNTASASTTVTVSADLGITKTGTGAVVAGNNVTYTITVTNTGPSDATGVSVADPTPAGLTFVSNTGNCLTAFPCSLGPIPAGATRAITSVFTVAPNYSGASPFTNTATVSSTSTDPTPGNNSASAQTTVTLSADLGITKTGTASVVPGDSVTYTITVSNTGPSDATGVSVADPTPAGLTFQSNSGNCVTAYPCALGSIPVGATRTITTVYAVGSGYSGPSPFTNTATVSSTSTDPTPGNNSASAQTTVQAGSADLGITKTGTTIVVPGANTTYTITVTNAGPSDATGVSVADPTPAGLTFVSNSGGCATAYPCSLGTLTPGATRTITTVYKVGSGYTGPSPFTNTATVSSTSADPTPGNNSASASTTVSTTSADLGITKTGTASVVPGNNVTYTITVTNNGPSDATGVSVADVTPAGLTFVSNAGNCTTPFPCSLGGITAGATRTITAVFKVAGNYAGPNPFTNTATVSATSADPVSSNDTASATTSVLSASADLGITATGPASVIPGTNATYTITVTNAGPSDATAVVVADPTPAGLTFVSNSGACTTAFPCALGALASGATQTITAVFKVGGSYSGPSPYSLTATVSATTADPTPANDTASASTIVGAASAALSITKTGPASIIPGQDVVYTLTVTNAGPSDAAAVSVADVTPAGLSFVSNAGDCATAFPCLLGTVVAGATRTITATFSLPAAYAGASPITNTATVSSSTADPSSSDNTALATSTVAAASADLSIGNAGPASLAPGNDVSYTITVTNSGPSDAVGVSVSEPTPSGLTFVSNSGDCSVAFPCSLGTIAAGQSRTITAVFHLPLAYSGPDPFQATATVSATTADPVAANNTSTASTQLPGADFYTVTPCRVIDSRSIGGGGPVAGGEDRTVTLVGGACGIPATARAVSFNLTVAGATANGNLRLFPLGAAAPLVSTINFVAGVTRANNGVIQLGTDGKVTIRCGLAAVGATDFVIDVNGYFK